METVCVAGSPPYALVVVSLLLVAFALMFLRESSRFERSREEVRVLREGRRHCGCSEPVETG